MEKKSYFYKLIKARKQNRYCSQTKALANAIGAKKKKKKKKKKSKYF